MSLLGARALHVLVLVISPTIPKGKQDNETAVSMRAVVPLLLSGGGTAPQFTLVLRSCLPFYLCPFGHQGQAPGILSAAVVPSPLKETKVSQSLGAHCPSFYLPIPPGPGTTVCAEDPSHWRRKREQEGNPWVPVLEAEGQQWTELWVAGAA